MFVGSGDVGRCSIMPGIAVLAVFFSTLVVDPVEKSDQEAWFVPRRGYWSDPMTWENGAAPREGGGIQVRAGHSVTYDVVSAWPVRDIHIAGTLTFATDRDTLLSVGLIKIEQGEDSGEDGFDCSAHAGFLDPALPRPALLVGTPERPVGARWNARIRLVPIAGMDRQTCPAIVCCGGRMDFHGAPMTRTWVKLGRAAKKGDVSISLAESVAGWRVGDHVIITATSTHENGRQRGTLRPVANGRKAFTEERTITELADRSIVLDRRSSTLMKLRNTTALKWPI